MREGEIGDALDRDRVRGRTRLLRRLSAVQAPGGAAGAAGPLRLRSHLGGSLHVGVCACGTAPVALRRTSRRAPGRHPAGVHGDGVHAGRHAVAPRRAGPRLADAARTGTRRGGICGARGVRAGHRQCQCGAAPGSPRGRSCRHVDTGGAVERHRAGAGRSCPARVDAALVDGCGGLRRVHGLDAAHASHARPFGGAGSERCRPSHAQPSRTRGARHCCRSLRHLVGPVLRLHDLDAAVPGGGPSPRRIERAHRLRRTGCPGAGSSTLRRAPRFGPVSPSAQ